MSMLFNFRFYQLPLTALIEVLLMFQRFYHTAQQLVDKAIIDTPVYLFSRDVLTSQIKQFQKLFNTRIVYSVKSNPSANILKILIEQGVTHFDVASLEELYSILQLETENRTDNRKLRLCYMNPVKSPKAIAEAYRLGVRVFSLDSLEELEKIKCATNNATDLSLHVRVATSNKTSAFNLSQKFGVCLTEASLLIEETRKVAQEFGICFHVGSQCMNEEEYSEAIEKIYHYFSFSEIKLDVLDIGGGFPLDYNNYKPKPLETYATAINQSLQKFKEDFPETEVWCEPGRVLVGSCEALLVQVEAVKNKFIYINDGTYGGLFDAGTPKFIFPTKVIRRQQASNTSLDTEVTDFSLFGPTCDCLDFMPGPFKLPINIKQGDYILFYNMGAYSKTLRSKFNGFGAFTEVEI